MFIKICLSKQEDNELKDKEESDEYALIELQGSLQHSLPPSENKPVAKLLYKNNDKTTPYLKIGYHMLKGKIVHLKKPFAIMRKDNPLILLGIVKQKFLFSSPPQIILSQQRNTAGYSVGGKKR